MQTRTKSLAIAAALAAGCVALPGFALAAGIDHEAGEPAGRKLDKQIAAAERAVAKAPQSAEARARLAQTYLAAGRFASAGTSFEDAVALGDKLPTTALGMALAYIGSGRNQEATALLGQWRETMPAGDYGLALALAGQSAEAVEILGATIQQGENTPKMRQNLAYAYALGGRLHEARVIASQDVPADQIEARVSDWALQASIGSAQSRVAALLGAPVRSDPGQPAQLALGVAPETPMLATAEAPVADRELPALGAEAPALAQAEPVAAPAPEIEPPAALAMAEPAPVARRFVSHPVIQDISARVERRQALAAAPAPRPPREAASTRPAAPRREVAPAAATHLVQLGSFTTEAGARRAWDIFVSRDPSLRERELRITQAMVNGRRYFRVAAAGFDAQAARAKCSTVRGSGGACLALADRRAQPAAPGAVPVRSGGQRLARS